MATARGKAVDLETVSFNFLRPSLFVILFQRSSHGGGLAGVKQHVLFLFFLCRTLCEEQYPFPKRKGPMACY